MKKFKVYKTEENTILIVTASTDGNDYPTSKRKYVSITANEIEPIKRSDAVAQVEDYLEF